VLTRHARSAYYFKSPEVGFVIKTTHGWMECFPSEGRTPESVYRLGQSLSILTLLRSSDHHSGNLIYSKGWPRLIDMECTFSPEMTFAQRSNFQFTPRATRVIDDLQRELVQIAYKIYLDGLMKIQKDHDMISASIKRIRSAKMRVVILLSDFQDACHSIA
jgi:lantibiotic modifying enzyme